MSELASGLLTREAIDIIFSGEVIFSAVLTLCIFLLVHSFLTFLKRSGPLYNRIAEIEAELDVLHASIPVRIQQIGALRHDMEPLQEDFRKVQAYHSLLVYLERKAAEEEAQKELEEAEEKSKETRRAKLGLDRFL